LHPSKVGKQNLAIRSISWQNLQELLLDEICCRFKEAGGERRSRNDITMTVQTLKHYIYFLQSLEVADKEEITKAADLIAGNPLLQTFYGLLG